MCSFNPAISQETEMRFVQEFGSVPMGSHLRLHPRRNRPIVRADDLIRSTAFERYQLQQTYRMCTGM
jgi:hypothetical protein